MSERDCTGGVLDDVRWERGRQERLKLSGKFPMTCADEGITNAERYTILGEEFGEVGHEVNEAIGNPAKLDEVKLRAELVQVAAVCVAWCEAIDRGGAGL